MDEYKIGSDIEHEVTFKDQDGADITLSTLNGYGIELFNPAGVSIGKWGVNLTGLGFKADTDYFEATDTATAKIRLTSDDYGTRTGNVTAELYINYTDAKYPDSLRDLWSEKKVLFKLR